MRFAIRDDDTNYFTQPEDLESIYKEIWNKCPISLSVVPFHASTKSGAIPKKYWQGDKIFPVGENRKLVKFLKEKIKEGKVSIMLHGYSHKDYESGYEFEVGDNLERKVKEGKEYLENLLSTEIKTFIPPHNTLSKRGMTAVLRNGLNILGSFSLLHSQRPFEWRNLVYMFKRRIFYFLTNNNYYPHVMRFRSHSELACSSLIPSTKIEDLISDFQIAYKYKGNFCLNTHYWELLTHETMRTTLYKFWTYINMFEGLNFVKTEELFRG